MLYIKLLCVFVISGSLTYLLIKFQNSINLFSYVNHRSIHKHSTPNSGGIAIVLSFLLSLFFYDFDIDFYIVFSLFFIFVAGLYDDKFGMSSKQKVFFVFVVANILYFNGFYVEHLGVFFGHSIGMSGVFAYIFLAFSLIGFVNALNLIDGLDGLASIVSIVILSSFLYLGIKFNDQFLIYMSAGYIMSLSGFLIFNWSPARIFMGDNGSLTLGLVISIVSIHAVNQHYITLVTTILLTALPILDTFIVMTRRIVSGKSPFMADKLHIHHLIYKQQSQQKPQQQTMLPLKIRFT